MYAHGDDCLTPICSPHSPLLKRFHLFFCSLSLSLSLSRSFFPFSHPLIIFVLLTISSPISSPFLTRHPFYFLPSPVLLYAGIKPVSRFELAFKLHSFYKDMYHGDMTQGDNRGATFRFSLCPHTQKRCNLPAGVFASNAVKRIP